MRSEAKFCSKCGEATARHTGAVRRRYLHDRNERGRAIKAVGWVFVLTLCGLVLPFLGGLSPGPEKDAFLTWPVLAVEVVSNLLVGAIGIWILAGNAFARSLKGLPESRWIGIAVATVPVTILIANAMVWVVTTFSPDDSEATFSVELSAIVVVGFTILPALLEEWLCRGVLWEALQRVVRPKIVVIGTAVLFAMMHGLNGAFVLELPHRFAIGLIYGWLRLKSGSLVPGIVAHFLHNLSTFFV